MREKPSWKASGIGFPTDVRAGCCKHVEVMPLAFLKDQGYIAYALEIIDPREGDDRTMGTQSAPHCIPQRGSS